MKRLVIAEKPSVAMSIASVLGVKSRKDGYLENEVYIVSWCVGHLAELVNADSYDERYVKWRKEDLPIIPASMKYRIPRDKHGQFEVLKKLMHREDVSEVVNACDAGREGELIFRNMYAMTGCKKPILRLWISSMEDAAIEQGFRELKDGKEYDNLFAAARCREWADWLVGINATRLFSVLYHRTLNVGRVVSPTLALLVQREAEINAFQPEPFYMLYDDNSEAMAFEPEDIQMFSGMFAVDRADWERVRGEIPPMDETLVRQKMEQAFHNSPMDAYAIYQLKREDSTTDLRFMGSDWLQKKGLEPNRDNYDLVYTGRLYPSESRLDTLERLYHMFNTDHPEDFRGHSLSVSDIVALKEQGVVSYHYVDSIGYTELPNFDKNYLKTAEMQLEDDYGMIDGIVNNGAKQPEQPKQNQPVKAADDRSERPSVLAKLRKLQAEDKQTAARHRSAERDEI